MDWTSVRAGDPIEPAVIGHRVWRYRLAPLTLLSFCLGVDQVWSPFEPFQSDKEPNFEESVLIPANGTIGKMCHGVHAFRTLNELREGFRDLPGTMRYRDCGTPFDGVVRGTVTLWGVCIDCERGYRAQYARPASFDEAHGERAAVALERLRRLFGVNLEGRQCE
jgi:hypothetical protein